MRATFTDEQEALAQTARELASRGLADARLTLDGSTPPDDLTRALTDGFAGVGVPEEAGGHGGGLVDLAILFEALGRSVAPTSFVSHVLAVQVALGAGLPVAALLRGRGAVADVVRDDTAVAVRDAEGASHLVVVHDDGVQIVAPGELRPRPALDTTRPLADVALPKGSERTDAGTGVLRAAALVAAELVGVGRGALERAVDYAKQREQFGQPIGRFQGVAHQLADAFVELEAAWSLVLFACWAVDDGDASAAQAVSAAKAKAAAAGLFAAERGVQVHGGIGITWEADPHLFLRRALADGSWFGAAVEHRVAVGRALVSGRPWDVTPRS